MKLNFLLLTLFTFALGFAQDNATISGKITDKDMGGEALPFASISIKGTSVATNADETGTYTLTIPAGTNVIVFGFLGYESKEVQITIAAGETQTINQELASSSVNLKDVVIEQTVNREKESTLLQEQKNAIEMKQAIGAQELTRKGINDAAGAVLKTTGVAKQEGVNNVFVRGLGDRYNSTTLNGLPLPSEDPVYKNISLEFFGSNIIKNININKTFSSSLYGDVAGANIDISSKELDKNSIFTVAAKSGFNSSAIGAGNFEVADKAYNYFGISSGGRNVPITNLFQYGFKSNLKTGTAQNPVNSGFNVVGGKKFNFGEDKSLSLFGVATNSSNYSYQEGFTGISTASGGYTKSMHMQKSQYDATQTLLANVKYRFGKGSVAVNSLYIHDDTQYVGRFLGYDTGINDGDQPDNQKSLTVRQQNNINNLFSNQLLGDYKFSDKLSANAGVAYNIMRAIEPDRKTNEYRFSDATQTYSFSHDSDGDNNRYFSKLNEDDLGGKAELNYNFNPESNLPTILTAGGAYRDTRRRFNFLQFNYDFEQPPVVDPNNPDAVLNAQNLALGKHNGGFDLGTDRGDNTNTAALDPFYYTGHRTIGSGYAKIVHSFNENFTAQVGVRFEALKQTIQWDTNISSSVNDLTVRPSNIDKKYVLPSVNLKYNLSEKHALRFAASETYTMPQFKEMAQFLYTDINNSEYGNPYLKPSTDYNVDVKYDFSPSKREIISIGGFYKYIQDPISRVQVASASTDYSYVNTEKAFVTGAELEIKKTIFSFDTDVRNNDLSFGLNASYLYTEQTQNDTPDDQLTVNFTHTKGKMQGASPLLINSDLSYNTSNEETSLLSTVVFNYFRNQVYTVGTFGRENIVQRSVPALDFVNRFDIKKYNLGINLSIMNILNPKYKLTMNTTDTTVLNAPERETLVNSYRKGIIFSLGLNWQIK